MRWGVGRRVEGNRKIKKEKKKCLSWISSIVSCVLWSWQKFKDCSSNLFLLSFHFCLSDGLPHWNTTGAPAFWQKSFWIGFLLAPGYLPLSGPTPSTKDIFASSILQIILGALASPGIHIYPVLPQAALVSQGMSEAPGYDFHFSKKHFEAFVVVHLKVTSSHSHC